MKKAIAAAVSVATAATTMSLANAHSINVLENSEGKRGIEGTQFLINNTGIPTSLEISFKAEHAGKFANLCKSENVKLVFVTCAKLDEDRKIILPDVAVKGGYVAMLCEFQ